MLDSYVVSDRAGVVHAAVDRAWRDGLDWNEVGAGDRGRIDETVCGILNYLKHLPDGVMVTCIQCLGVDDAV